MPKLILTVTFLTILTIHCLPATTRGTEAPYWFTKPPQGEHFIYFRAVGENENGNLESADLRAQFNALVNAAEYLNEIQVSSETIQKIKTAVKRKNDKLTEDKDIKTIIDGRSKVDGVVTAGIWIKFSKDVWEADGTVRQYLLLRVPRKVHQTGLPSKKMANVLSFIPFAAAGQYYKKQYAPGVFFMSGQIATGTGWLITALMSRSNRHDADDTNIQSERDDYNARADNLFIAATILGAACGGLYVASLLHGIFYPRKDYLYEPKQTALKPNVYVMAMPSFSKGNGLNLALSVQF